MDIGNAIHRLTVGDKLREWEGELMKPTTEALLVDLGEERLTWLTIHQRVFLDKKELL